MIPFEYAASSSECEQEDCFCTQEQAHVALALLFTKTPARDCNRERDRHIPIRPNPPTNSITDNESRLGG